MGVPVLELHSLMQVCRLRLNPLIAVSRSESHPLIAVFCLDLDEFIERSHLEIALSKTVFLLLLPLLPSLLLVHSTQYNYYFTVTTTTITTTSTATTTT
eukprot:4761520-Pyramimonas_sp.AAC.1